MDLAGFLYHNIPSAYLKRSYALTNTSSLPMARMASQFKMMATNGRHTVHERENVTDSSFNIKIKVANAA